jgi:hypothetical protein
MKMKILRIKSVLAGIFLFLLPLIVSGQTFFLTVFVPPIPAAAREKPLFAGSPALFNHDVDDNGLFSRCYWDGPGSMSSRAPIDDKPRVSTGKVIGEILLGMVGNFAGGLAGALIGVQVIEDDGEGLIHQGAVLGYLPGSMVGSALGVYLIGNTGNARGSFGRALFGSFLGEVAAFAILLVDHEGSVGIVSFLVLPPICAALMFNRSLRYKSLPGPSALLNFDRGKIRIGIPDIRIQPLRGCAKNAKPEVRFSINLLGIAL